MFDGRRHPLHYPAGIKPDFDPAHVCGARVRFSGIAIPGNYLNILTGKPGTISGTPTHSFHGLTGPVTKFPTSTNAVTFSGPTTNDTSVTIAAIGAIDNANSEVLFATSSANSGWRLGNAGGGKLYITAGGVLDVDSFISPGTGPCFMVASSNATTANFVVLNLATGVIKTATVGGAASNSPNGTYVVGDAFAANQHNPSGSSAIMFSAAFHALAELVKWAEKPWGFWYPEAA